MKRAKEVEPPPADQLITRLLTKNTVISALLQQGLDTMLRESGATPKFREAVAEFIQPAIEIMNEAEKEVIDFVRRPEGPEIER